VHNLVDHIVIVVVHYHHLTSPSPPSTPSHVFPLVGECSAVGLLQYYLALFSLLSCLWLPAAIFLPPFFCFLLLSFFLLSFAFCFIVVSVHVYYHLLLSEF